LLFWFLEGVSGNTLSVKLKINSKYMSHKGNDTWEESQLELAQEYQYKHSIREIEKVVSNHHKAIKNINQRRKEINNE